MKFLLTIFKFIPESVVKAQVMKTARQLATAAGSIVAAYAAAHLLASSGTAETWGELASGVVMALASWLIDLYDAKVVDNKITAAKTSAVPQPVTEIK